MSPYQLTQQLEDGRRIRLRVAGPEAPIASTLKTELRYHLLCDSLGRALKLWLFTVTNTELAALFNMWVTYRSWNKLRLWSQTHLGFKSSSAPYYFSTLNIALPVWAQFPPQRIVAAPHALRTHSTRPTGAQESRSNHYVNGQTWNEFYVSPHHCYCPHYMDEETELRNLVNCRR